MARGQYPGAPTVDHRTRIVAAVRLRRRPPWSLAARSCCWWPGWPGAATASSSPCATAPYRVCSPAWTASSATSAVPPTYLLTDNEKKTVTVGHIAGVPVRNRAAVTFGRYYGISVLTCEPADPASKGGGVEKNAVKLAKADIVPTETNLLPQYDSFADVEAACAGFTTEINARTTAPRVAPGGDAHR